MNARTLTDKGRGTAEQAANSKAMDAAARWGFVARGAIYLLVGVLALRVAFGGGSGGGGQQADRGGALAEIAAKPMGAVLLWALGAGLVGMALWRLSEALFGAAGPDGHKAGKRLLSAGRAVFYGFTAYSVLAFAAGDEGSGSGSSDQESRDITARALELPGGRWIVGVAGAAIAAAGLWIGVRAVLRKYHKHLKLAEMSRPARRFVDVTGVGGGTARGALFTVAGVFVVLAAVAYEPDRAKGVDDTLRSFTETSAGPWLLALVAVGLMLFGLFSWAMARWRRV
ncbi:MULTISPECIES: DUF1206 domain-containing protein [unclassified Streptomyces]|uniref:DUF1206 domain-containing protein n=1 Tax=unclassified Streptomyces TaxID=2593676 RepID=UPI002E76DCE3|nr:DUF1206 domain-containing protein [Streptomyces sp. JV176]MEE1797864.1 DUF1206 domain-containing protein [Streptomyces sp. JV176]